MGEPITADTRLAMHTNLLANRVAALEAEVGRLNDVVATLERTAPTLAEQAIGLFIELRDVHGCDEETARARAVTEMAEGTRVVYETSRASDSRVGTGRAPLSETAIRRPAHQDVPGADLQGEGAAPGTPNQRGTR